MAAPSPSGAATIMAMSDTMTVPTMIVVRPNSRAAGTRRPTRATRLDLAQEVDRATHQGEDDRDADDHRGECGAEEEAAHRRSRRSRAVAPRVRR